MPEGEIEIPELWETVKALDQVVDVDYYVPGCPPVPDQIWKVVEAILSGSPLPPRGSVLGAGKKTCCDECARKKEEKKLTQFFRPYEIMTDPERCLLEQGIVCMGPATRDGCGASLPGGEHAVPGLLRTPPERHGPGGENGERPEFDHRRARNRGDRTDPGSDCRPDRDVLPFLAGPLHPAEG